tara:strand:- start:1986 stop:2456 length:471 start_codon:yes stop_codon:yes gene_type:complete
VTLETLFKIKLKIPACGTVRVVTGKAIQTTLNRTFTVYPGLFFEAGTHDQTYGSESSQHRTIRVQFCVCQLISSSVTLTTTINRFEWRQFRPSFDEKRSVSNIRHVFSAAGVTSFAAHADDNLRLIDSAVIVRKMGHMTLKAVHRDNMIFVLKYVI